MPQLINEQEASVVDRTRDLLATYEQSRDLVEMGAYREGARADVDQAIERVPQIMQWARQAAGAPVLRTDGMKRLSQVVGSA